MQTKGAPRFAGTKNNQAYITMRARCLEDEIGLLRDAKGSWGSADLIPGDTGRQSRKEERMR